MSVAGKLAGVDQDLLKLARESAALLPALRERLKAESGKPDADAGQLAELRKSVAELERAVSRVRYQPHGAKTERAPAVNRLQKSAGHKYSSRRRGPAGHWIYTYADEHGSYERPHIRDLHHLAAEHARLGKEIQRTRASVLTSGRSAKIGDNQAAVDKVITQRQKLWEGHDVEHADFRDYLSQGKPLPADRRANYAGREDDEPEPEEEEERAAKPASAASSWHATTKEHGFANPNAPGARASTEKPRTQKNDMPNTEGWSLKQLRDLRDTYARKGYSREQRLVQRQMDELKYQQQQEKAKAAAKTKADADKVEQKMMFSQGQPRLVLRKAQAARGGSGRFTLPGSADHLGAHRKTYHQRKQAGEIAGSRQDWLDHVTDGWSGEKETHKLELLRELRHLEADARGMAEGPDLDKANGRIATLRKRLAKLGHKA